ncbi:MAG: neutral/alkaline non-lysosomal ceramidase N-terminal domain-containing protein [Planctomycetia bacterium]|nr:neutral/alkaline non-lysosomal ceramidase N-terminal domain-containing protein [Planctomycetia bacterium]
MHRTILTSLVFFSLFASAASGNAAEAWRAGVAETSITPAEPMWMSGYGARTAPAEGTQDELMAKAVVLESSDAAGASSAGRKSRVVLITLDLVGIDRAISLELGRRLHEKFGLERRQIAINCSHTHCGPVVGTNLGAMYSLTDAQWKQVADYQVVLLDKIVDVVGRALADLAPVRPSWGSGTATFAVNRRENKEKEVPALRAQGATLRGPIDHDVPVLALHAADGRLKAVVFGYACHATTLGFQKWCADYPGYAYRTLQTSHPGTVALFWAGCGADQNPIPRRTLEYAEQYGRQLAAAVEKVLASGTLKPIAGTIDARYEEVSLDLAHLPTSAELEATAAKGNKYEQGRARRLLATIAKEGKLAPTYPYPVETWQLGDGPRWVILGGEVVVDYALRIKQERTPAETSAAAIDPTRTWVAGYSNDVMAYIPSRRVLAEGGYEGATSMIYYGLPSPWAPMLEEAIIRAVRGERR